MADPLSYNQLLEKSKEIDELLKSSIDNEEKEELEYIWNCLKSREESKFDAIISVIKDCDKQISTREKEIIELKNNQEFWKNKRKTIINIIKTAYENRLISSMPTGNKYQATIKSVKSKLIDDFDNWSAEEKIKFGLVKETFLKRIFSGEVLNKSEEKLPDKEHLRRALVENPTAAPSKAKLVQRVSLTYNLRKRLKTGI
jgi:membrane-associated HD superfamily phosphohydrolase